MKIVFMGTPDFAVPSLHALTEAGYAVAAVVTQPDKPKGRGKTLLPTPVKEEAVMHDIPVYQPEKVRNNPEFLEILKEINPEIIVVAAYGQIIPKEILELPKFGCINIHASLLPKYRGAAPIQQAVIDGEKVSGVTIQQMGEGLDTGDMIDKVVVPIDAKETGESLHDKLAAAGGPLLLEVLEKLEAGTAVRTRQNDEESCYAKMLTKDLGKIDWNKDAASIERLIRGLNSWPSAYTAFHDKTLKIWDADVEKENGSAQPGAVAKVTSDAIYVQTGEGLLKINEVQIQGKKRMPVKAFLLGHKVEEGTLLGENA